MSAYLDGELAARPRRRMKRHVGACRECRRLIGGLTAVIDAMHRLPGAEDGARALQIVSSVRGRLSEPPGS